jgi:hypothetical protein
VSVKEALSQRFLRVAVLELVRLDDPVRLLVDEEGVENAITGSQSGILQVGSNSAAAPLEQALPGEKLLSRWQFPTAEEERLAEVLKLVA